MERDEVLQRLQASRGKLTAFNVKVLAIFGSVARGEARPDSDVDVLVEFNGPTRFDSYMDLKLFLEELLGRRVDLLTRKGIRPDILPAVQQEAVYALVSTGCFSRTCVRPVKKSFDTRSASHRSSSSPTSRLKKCA